MVSQASDWDEASFKETVTRMVARTLARPETESWSLLEWSPEIEKTLVNDERYIYIIF